MLYSSPVGVGAEALRVVRRSGHGRHKGDEPAPGAAAHPSNERAGSRRCIACFRCGYLLAPVLGWGGGGGAPSGGGGLRPASGGDADVHHHGDDEVGVNRPRFDAASFLAKDGCHAEEIPERSA